MTRNRRTQPAPGDPVALPGLVVRPDEGMAERVFAEVVRAAVEGVGPLKGARELVDPLRERGMTTSAIVTRLVRTQSTQATLQGAVTGVGGLLTATLGLLPSTAAAVFVQARLAAAIAHAHGHDVDHPQVRGTITLLVTGASTATGVKRAGTAAGERAVRSALPRLQARAASRAATRAATGRTVSALTARAATGGLGRAVPVVGAVVGGAVDLAVTRRIADRARHEFAAPPALPRGRPVPLRPAPGPLPPADPARGSGSPTGPPAGPS